MSALGWVLIVLAVLVIAFGWAIVRGGDDR